MWSLFRSFFLQESSSLTVIGVKAPADTHYTTQTHYTLHTLHTQHTQIHYWRSNRGRQRVNLQKYTTEGSEQEKHTWKTETKPKVIAVLWTWHFKLIPGFSVCQNLQELSTEKEGSRVRFLRSLRVTGIAKRNSATHICYIRSWLSWCTSQTSIFLTHAAFLSLFSCQNAPKRFWSSRPEKGPKGIRLHLA